MHALRDVTPERFSRLEKELVRAKGEIVRGTFLHFHAAYKLPTLLDPPTCAPVADLPTGRMAPRGTWHPSPHRLGYPQGGSLSLNQHPRLSVLRLVLRTRPLPRPVPHAGSPHPEHQCRKRRRRSTRLLPPHIRLFRCTAPGGIGREFGPGQSRE